MRPLQGVHVRRNEGFTFTGIYNYLLPQNVISYNAILTLTISLLTKHVQIKSFYQKLFPVIYVDEFQDTNILSYSLIRFLIGDNSHIYLSGDPLQRIYGFIGAMPKLMERAKTDLGLHGIALLHNYRFKDNQEMLVLDYNIRRNAESLVSPAIESNASINLRVFQDQEEEASYICSTSLRLVTEDPDSKVAVLFRAGTTNKNTTRIIDEFNSAGIDYFFGMFSDEDEDYRQYHRSAYAQLIKELAGRDLSKRVCRSVMKFLKDMYRGKSILYDSLIVLSEIFFRRLFVEYNYLSEEEKEVFAKETLDGFGLKQYLEYVESKVVLSTIHGAKGLEWEYVIMPDMEQFSLPSWMGACSDCLFKQNCEPVFTPENESAYLDELSVFYVGFTRAKKQIYFSASEIGLNYKGEKQQRNISCFLKLPGVVF